MRSTDTKVVLFVCPFLSALSVLIHNNKSACLIDAGKSESLLRYLKDNDLNLISVLLTHTHYDHINGLESILKVYPQCIVFTNESGAKALSDKRLNLSLYHDDEIEITPTNIRLVVEGEYSNDLLRFQVIETPGHNDSCICYHINDILFTGDSFIPSLNVVTKLPGSNKKQAQDSRDRILNYIKENELKVIPGHYIDNLDIANIQIVFDSKDSIRTFGG